MKIGRDGKTREVNIAYRVMRDDHWTHNVVKRPTREIIKLFELSDTTFADDMKAVHKAAKEILVRRGAFDEENRENIAVDQDNEENIDVDDPTDENLVDTAQSNYTRQNLLPAAEASRTNSRHSSKGSHDTFLDTGDLCCSDSRKQHQPFLTCLGADNWHQLEVGAQASDWNETVPGGGDGCVWDSGCSNDDDEMLFLI